jgi:hypothetical protein
MENISKILPYGKSCFCLFVCLFSFVCVCVCVCVCGLWFELRAYTLGHSIGPFFLMGFFEIGSQELFAQADLVLRFS